MRKNWAMWWGSPRVWVTLSLLVGLLVVYPDRNFSLRDVNASTSITAPTTVAATLNSFVAISTSGTTPAVSGFADGSVVQVTVSATHGAVKIGTTTGLTAPTGYTSAQWTADNSTEISFYGLQTDVSNALGTLSYKATSSAATPTVSISAFLSGPAYNPANGHFYEVVTSGGTISWEEARCKAKYSNGRYDTGSPARASIASNDRCVSTDGNSLTRRTLNGRKGYLANITSIEEHRFLGSKLSTTGWIGGADTETEGTWKWMDGPESGQTFWLDSLHNASNFSANRRTSNTIDGRSMFNYWSGSGSSYEPNNASNLEHYAEFGFGSDGEGKSWNDCQNGCNRTRYVIEYGESDDTVSAASASISVPIVAAPGAPTGVTAVAQNAQVALTWTAPADTGGDAITDYVIQYCVGATCTTFADGTSTTTSTTVTGLSNGTTYTFTVAAVNSRGAGSTATSGSATPRGQLTNGSFENGTTGWSFVGIGSNASAIVDLGVTTLGGCVSQDTQNYTTSHLRGNSTPLNDNPSGVSNYSASRSVESSITGVTITAGTNALMLKNSATASGYHVLHGPVAVSDVFSATQNQVITLDWFARYVSDDFAILGYLLDTETCTQYEIIDTSGRTVSGWQSASVTIPATKATYRFVFVNGTFDASGGTVSGAELYIDNISVGAPQTITFGTITEKNTSTLPFDLEATASSGLSVSYVSLTEARCTVSGSRVTIVSSGTCSIQASQSGGTSGGILYAAAAAVTQSFTIALRDTTPPSATWTAPSSPQTSRTFTYSLAFSESVSGVAAGDFSNVAASDAASGCVFTPSAASGSSITVSVTCSSDGNVTLRLAAGSLSDSSGNAGPASSSDASSVLIDSTVPSATWTAPSSPQTSRTFTYSLAFSESVSGVAAGDYSNVAASDAAAGCVFTPSAASGSSITVSVTCSSDGNVTLRLAANAVTDDSGNTGPTAVLDASSVLIDATVPDAPNRPTLATSSDLGASASDDITSDTTPTIEVTGLELGTTAVITAAKSGASLVTCTVVSGSCTLGSVGSPLVSGTWSITVRQTDAAGNQSPASPALSITIDDSAPTVTLERLSATSSVIGITFRIIADEEVVCADLSTVADADFALTNITSLTSIVQTDAETCTITAIARASIGGGAVASQLDAAPGFAITDIAGNAQTTLTGAPVTITVNIPAPPVVVTTTTTIAPSVTSAPTTVAPRNNRTNRGSTTTVPGNRSVTTTTIVTATTQPQLLRPLAPPPSSTTTNPPNTQPSSTSGAVSTLAPTTTTANTVPASLAPTEVVVVLDNQERQPAVRQVDNEYVETVIDDTILKVKAVDQNDEPHSLLPNGSLLLTPGTFTKVEGEGMLPASDVEVWLYSTPTLLGVLMVDANGEFVGSVKVPDGIEVGSHKIQVVGLSPQSEKLTVGIGVVVAQPEVLAANNAGRLTEAQASLLAQPTVRSVSVMTESSAANVIVFLMVLFMLVSALVTAQPLGRRRSRSLVEMVMTITPWNAHNPVLRLATLGVGALVGIAAASSSNFTIAAPSTWLTIAWICIGVVDVAAGGVAGLAFASTVAVSGGINSGLDLRLLAVFVAMGVLPSLLSLALRRRIQQPVVSLVVSALMHAIVATTLVLSVEALSGMYFDVHDSLNLLAACVVLAVAVRHALSAQIASAMEPRDVLSPVTRFGAMFIVGVVFLTPATITRWSIGTWVLASLFAALALPSVRARIAVRPYQLVAAVATTSIVVVSAGLVQSSSDSAEFADATETALEVEAVRTVSGATGLVDGFPATLEAMLTTDGAINVSALGTAAVVSVASLDENGEVIPLGLEDQMQVLHDGFIHVRVTGAGVNLSATVWLFSEPILVGNAVANDNGTIDAVLDVPKSAPDGFHTVQVRLTDSEGRSVSIALPVSIAGSFVDASA